MSNSVSNELFDLVHADLWGPYARTTNDNCNQFLTILEDKSRTTWVFLLTNKSQVSSILKEFLAYVQNQFCTSIKVVRTDNGSEFVNKDLSATLAASGVIHQTSCIYTQNDRVELGHYDFMLGYQFIFGAIAC